MLWSLGVAAVAGVLVALLPTRWFAERVTATAIVTAVAAAAALGLSRLLDRDRTRGAGLLGIALVVIEFLLLLTFVWFEQAMSGHMESALAGTVGVLFLLGIFATTFMWMLNTRPGRIAAITGLTLTVISFIIFQVAAWTRVMWSTLSWQAEDKLWSLGWTVAGFGLAATACIAGFEPGDRRYWRWIGVALAVVGTAVTIGELYYWWDEEQWIATLASAAGFVGYILLALIIPLRIGQGWVRLVGIGAALALATFITLDAWTPGYPSDEDVLQRGLAASAIVTSCVSLAMLILVALNRRPTTRLEDDREEVSLTIICPRCSQKQIVPAGASSCRKCGVRFRIEVETPHCPQCDYILYDATGRCPECGAEVTGPTPGVV